EKSNIADEVAHYRLSTVGIDKSVGLATFVISVSRLDENRTVLGGRLGPVFGAPGAKTVFVDGEFAANLGHNWTVTASARRGWTKFGGGAFTTSGYSADF